jgi:hypothetical protein
LFAISRKKQIGEPVSAELLNEGSGASFRIP